MVFEKQISELTIERWSFSFLYGNLILDSYYLMEKESKKHRKYKVVKRYDRLTNRDNNISENDLPFTDEIRSEVLKRFVSNIKVLKWSEK